MALTFSHAVGYRGINSLRNHLVLCTGGNINLTQDPIMGSGVWGAGYANIAPIAYAWNYLQMEGSSNFELTSDTVAPSGGDDLWTILKKACITDRTKQSDIELLPDGLNGFNGKGWCSSLSFDASEGSAINGTYNFKGDPNPGSWDENRTKFTPDMTQGIISEGDWTGADGNRRTSGNNPPSESEFTHGKSVHYRRDDHHVELAGSTLVPYWRTCVAKNCADPDEEGNVALPTKFQTLQETTDPVKLKDIISWNCSYNSDLQLLKCCNLEFESPLSADYILCGEASAEGSYTVFRLSNEFAGGAYHSVNQTLTFFLDMSQEESPGHDRTGAISCADALVNITIPYVIVTSGSTSMTTGAQYVTCEFSFNGIGNGVDPILCMSDGKYVSAGGN